MFSKTEEKILKALGRKALMVAEITDKVYTKKNRPLTAANTVAGSILRINRKCKFYKLDWEIKSYGSGRGGKIVWVGDA